MSTSERLDASALGVAMLRGLETARPDALFTDPFAGPLLRAAGTVAAAMPTDRSDAEPRYLELADQFAARTRFFDEAVE